MDIAFYSEIGDRNTNEDAAEVVSSECSVLLILADGVGSCENGRLASATLVSTVRGELNGCVPDEDALIDAIGLAGRILRESTESVSTTAAVVWLGEDGAVAAHVGDSRIYQFRDDRIVYQSMDHSVAQLAVLAGELPPDAIRTSPDKNRLIRAVGSRSGKLRVDTEELRCQPGDAFLLCTDGFWNEVTEEEMLEDGRNAATAQEWLGRMRARIGRRNVRLDNHSAIVLRI